MAIRLVLFDMDDVVYAYDRDRRIAVLAERTGLPAAEIEARIWGSGFQDDADAGLYPTVDAYLDGWTERLGVGVGRALWTEARAAGLTPIEGTLALVRALSVEDGIAVGVLTNNGPLLFAERFALVPDLAAVAGGRFLVSADLGARKPDPAVFRRALERLGYAPDETVFVDDLAENAAGAAAAGLHAIVFRNPESLRDALEGFGLRV